MTLEATIVLIDNSDYAINGDYFPTRLGAQVECAGTILQAKLDANPESVAGLATLAGKHPEILCTPTNDPQQAQAYLFGIRCRARLNFSQGLMKATLALKHRTNQKQAQRLVAFVASELSESEDELIALAKRLKKGNIAVDLIALGELGDSQKNKLLSFHQAVNNRDNSLLVFVEPTQNELRQYLQGSPLLGAVMPPMGNEGENVEAVDPSMDPEMAEAIRISLLEEEERQKRARELHLAKEDKFSEEEVMKKAQEISQQEQEYKEDKKKVLQDKEFVNELLENIDLEEAEEEDQLLGKDKEKSKDKDEKKDKDGL